MRPSPLNEFDSTSLGFFVFIVKSENTTFFNINLSFSKNRLFIAVLDNYTKILSHINSF